MIGRSSRRKKKGGPKLWAAASLSSMTAQATIRSRTQWLPLQETTQTHIPMGMPWLEQDPCQKRKYLKIKHLALRAEIAEPACLNPAQPTRSDRDASSHFETSPGVRGPERLRHMAALALGPPRGDEIDFNTPIGPAPGRCAIVGRGISLAGAVHRQAIRCHLVGAQNRRNRFGSVLGHALVQPLRAQRVGMAAHRNGGLRLADRRGELVQRGPHARSNRRTVTIEHDMAG